MHNNRHGWKEYAFWGLMVLSAVLLFFATAVTKTPGDDSAAAERMERLVAKRMAILDWYVEQAVSGNPSEWMDLGDVPPDMVIYRYVEDTLQSWSNTFTVSNDDIGPKLLFQRLSNPSNSVSSPLSDVSAETSFDNIGQAWYLLKSRTEGKVKVIAGLGIMNALDTRTSNNVNPLFRLDDKFSVAPLTESGGSPVCIDGAPQFKVVHDTLKRSSKTDSFLVWLALVVFLFAGFLFLSVNRCFKRFYIVVGCIAAALIAIYFWGAGVQNEAYIFSPTLFADGQVLYSLGAVLIINMAIFSLVFCVYLMRRAIFRRVCKSGQAAMFAWSAIASLAIVCILAYTHLAFRSIVVNSNINLEIYKLGELTGFSALVLASFITMLSCLPLLFQMLRPAVKAITGKHFDALSAGNRLIMAALLGVYFVATPAFLGFKKESDKTDVWANRLSVDRDISLELQLRRVETSIAGDYFIASLSVLPNAGNIILNRIVDNFMYSLSQDYDISVVLFGDNERDPALRAYFNDLMRSGVSISEGSRFSYSTTASGHPRYAGLFTYFHANYGLHYMVVEVEPKSSREYGGYSALLGISDPGKVTIPAKYSYARYNNLNLVSYKGNYAYPTVMTDEFTDAFGAGLSHVLVEGYRHFLFQIEKDEAVIISRRKEPVSNYAVASLFLALLAFILFTIMSVSRRRVAMFETSYFRNRITSVLMFSLIFTLVAMAVVSVFFVYKRNDANRHEMMSDKINSIQALISPAFRYVDDYRQLNPQELTAVMDNAGNMAKADITLYSTRGKAFKSTASDVFDRMLISDRINHKAFYNIVYEHKRYFINKERSGDRRYSTLYAPLFNDSGRMVAICSSPYTEESYDFEMDAVMHSVTILTLFLILLIIARFMATSVVDRMLRPIVQIGRKMKKTDIDNPEYIEYGREDEISSLVQAYNLMVHDLSESTRQLAQAERDKAWSSMARQVAHEIKNPLTPMKLQLQRLIRLKQRNAPGWENKFDEVAKVVLDHIDILTDTANDFSTFAKLYTQEPTYINLDALLQEEISMFDNHEGISFSYMGIDGAGAMGPKPQLTRVFVNLITNSIQAIEVMRQEQKDAGQEPVPGRIIISLRHSSRDGWYDIVFEDNGPGVKSENRSKLFTPNFTTKNGGTGLGLAMSRSILEKCGAEISYEKSFSLDGACFTIRYPKG